MAQYKTYGNRSRARPLMRCKWYSRVETVALRENVLPCLSVPEYDGMLYSVWLVFLLKWWLTLDIWWLSWLSNSSKLNNIVILLLIIWVPWYKYTLTLSSYGHMYYIQDKAIYGDIQGHDCQESLLIPLIMFHLYATSIFAMGWLKTLRD